jgi:hypothetical protein
MLRLPWQGRQPQLKGVNDSSIRTQATSFLVDFLIRPLSAADR